MMNNSTLQLNIRNKSLLLLTLALVSFFQAAGQTTINYGQTVNASAIAANSYVIINAGGTLNMDVNRTFSNIYIGNNGTATISGSADLTVTNNISFTDPGSNKSIVLDLNNSGSITFPAFDYTTGNGQSRAFQINLNNGSLLVTAGTPFPTTVSNGTIGYTFNNSGTTVNYSGGSQTVLSVNYHHLSFSGSGTKTMQTGTTSIAGNFTVDNVTTTAVTGLTIGGNVILEQNFNLTGGNFTHSVAGNWTRNGWGSYTPSTGTINFTGSSSAINGTQAGQQTFNNITVSKTAGQTLSLGGSLTTLNVSGNFTLTSGAFAQGSIPVVISGNWVNNGGTVTAGSSAITLNGSGRTIGGTSSTTFNNLTINNNAGGISLLTNQIVNGTLTLSNGLLKLGSFNLTLGSSAPAVSGSFYTGNMVVADGTGELRKVFTGNSSYFFPIGDNSDGTANYSPVNLTFASGTYAGGAFAGVRVTDAKHPNNSSPANFLTRYWSISQSGISGFSATVSANYEYGGDITGQEYLQTAARYSGGAWTYYGSLASNTLTASGINTFGDFTGVGIPSISTSVNSLSGFTYVEGAGPSTQQNFTINAVNLTSNLILTPPSNYEISTGAVFQSTPLTLTPSGGVVNFTTIYVRLQAGLSAGTYNSLNLVASSTGASSQNITLSGSVTGGANGISTSAISGSPFCAGSAVNVPFTISGTYTAGNVFTAQLSNSSGSFATPVSIGTLSSTSAGTISATIPSGTTTGSGYRIRVISSTPAITGSNNGSNLTINSLPVVAAIGGGSSLVCVGASTPAFTNSTPGGIWSVTNGTGSASITAGGILSGISSGTVTVNYTVTSSGCSTTVTSPVTVNALPVVAAIGGGSSSVCVGASTPAFTNSTPGGTWSVTNGTGSASITAGGILTGISAGTVTVNYTVTNSGCSTTVTSPVTVNALPVVAAIGGGSSSVCVGASTPAFTNSTPGGTWSVTNGTGSASITAGGILTGISAGTVTVNYTVTSSGCSTTVTSPVTVNALPVVAAIGGGSSSVCAGASTPAFTNSTPGGIWSVTNGTGSASITAGGILTGISSGTVTVNYTVTSSGCSTTVTTPVTVNALPVVAAIGGGSSSVCVGASTPAFTNSTPGGIWSVTNGTGSASITAGGILTGISSGTVTVNYTVTSSGCSTTVSTLVTIIAFPTATISGNSLICAGNSAPSVLRLPELDRGAELYQTDNLSADHPVRLV